MTTVYSLERAPLHLYRDHPESPGRFDLLEGDLERIGAQMLASRVATRDEVGRIHNGVHIEAMEQASKQGKSIIDMAPTFVTHSSFDDAMRAAGATLACLDAVLDGYARNAFAIVRPPGHHAEPERAMGFCIFNNVAIAAKAALARGLGRVAIVDFDAHHGNGTEAAFAGEPRVAYLSTHQWGIYPGTGWFEVPAPWRQRIVDVPLPGGAGDQAFGRVSAEIIEPFVSCFEPDLLLVSAGFDAHWSDPIASLGLSTAGFHRMSADLVRLAAEHCHGKIVFVLEGGYDPRNLARGVRAVFSALMNTPFVDPHDASPSSEPDLRERLEAVRRWHGFGA